MDLSLSGLMAFGTAFATHNPWLIAVLGIGYFVWPGAITKVFQLVEDKVNGFKFTLFGKTFDLGQTDWDEKVNHYLRDWVISLYSQVSTIKDGVVDGTVKPEEAQAQLETMTQDVVDYFLNKAPSELKDAAIAKFGGDKVLAAEYLIRRVQAIMHDVHLDAKKNLTRT